MRVRFWAFVLPVILMNAPLAGAAKAQTLNLADYKGKVVYLDFWASWCAPCRVSFPWMNELAQVYGPKGVAVVAVNVDHDRALADEFLRQTPGRFKIFYDPKGDMARHYDLKGMPTTFLIGKDGAVHFVHEGFTAAREGEYLAQLNSLIAADK